MIELGRKVRDIHTPFEGIAVSRTEHLYGPADLAVLPTHLGSNGERRAVEWFPEARLRVVEDD